MKGPLFAAMCAAVVGVSSNAGALDLKAGDEPALKVTKLQLGIQSPKTNACPTQGRLNVWVFTNKAGEVPVYVAREGGSVAGPFVVEAKETGNGTYMGTLAKILQIQQPIDARYRASAPQYEQLSNWVPLKASCKVNLGGNALIGN